MNSSTRIVAGFILCHTALDYGRERFACLTLHNNPTSKTEPSFRSFRKRTLHYGWLSKLGPLLGYPKYWVPYYNRDPKRDHNFDNHPYGPTQLLSKCHAFWFESSTCSRHPRNSSILTTTLVVTLTGTSIAILAKLAITLTHEPASRCSQRECCKWVQEGLGLSTEVNTPLFGNRNRS